MEDVLAKLFAFKWRDVEVPVTKIRFSLAHDLVEHKYWGVDGARVEATGLAPVRISASIPLYNGLARGPAESFDEQLYPTVMRKLLLAFAKRESGVLWHPEFGGIPCKAERIDIDLEAEKRTGASAEASWIETTDDDVAFDVQPSPAADADAAAGDLDGMTNDLSLIVPLAPQFETTWSDLVNDVIGALDQVSTFPQRASAPFLRMKAQAERLQAAVQRVQNALGWPAVSAAERLKSIANDAAKRAASADSTVGIYVVPGDTTLAGVQAGIPGASVTDLIALNPKLVASAVVPKGTKVRYRIARRAA